MNQAATFHINKRYHLGNTAFHYLVVARIFPFAILWLFALFAYLARAFFPSSWAQYQIIVVVVQFLPTILFMMGILIIIFAYVITRIEHQTSTIMLDTSSLHITRGIFNKMETIVPYHKVQSVQIKQSLLFRFLNLARLVITTTFDIEQPSYQVDDEANDEVIEVVDYPLAQVLEDKLTEASHQSVTSH